MPTFYDPAGCYTTYDPTCCCTATATTTTNNPILSNLTGSINITPNTITWASNDKEQKEYIEKLEKHIDELEEDIEYFNGQLQEKNEIIQHLLGKEHELEKNMSNMDSHITYIEAHLQALEDKIHE